MLIIFLTATNRKTRFLYKAVIFRTEDHRDYFLLNTYIQCNNTFIIRGSRGHDHMVIGFTTTCAINAHHH